MTCFRVIPIIAVWCLVATLLNGCALTKDQINLVYEPGASSRLEGSNSRTP